jgi:ABC-type dipeptide/oligopeptide/nickel transport system ATPase subunit
MKKSTLLEECKALQEQKEYLLSSWKEHAEDAEPNELELENLMKAFKTKKSEIKSALNIVTEIHNKLEMWSECQELNATNEQIASILETENSSSEEDESKRREKTLRVAKKRLEKFDEVKAGLDWLKEELSQETSRYARDVLDSLNSLINKFLTALTSGKKWKIENDAYITNRRTGLKTQVLWDNISNQEQSVTANQVLSEGQMSAVTLSQLLSMSSAYQWSKWRALLLDDPTQHNDLIHVASFIEVLKNLVLYRDYQIIICSHDLEEANFIKRKLQASEINVATINFLGHSASGVLTEKVLA